MLQPHSNMNPTRIFSNGSQSFARLALLTVTFVLGVAGLEGQGLTPLWAFTDGNDGAYPYESPLIQGPERHSLWSGLLWRRKSIWHDLRAQYEWRRRPGLSVHGRELDGAYPESALLLGADGRLYGTAEEGGAFGDGTIFAVRTDGTGFTSPLFRFRIAGKFSDDPDSKDVGGDLGKIGIDQIEPSFMEILKTMKQGEISVPVKVPLGTLYGYHIVWVRSITPEHTMNLDQDYHRLERLALQFKTDRDFQQWVEEMRKNIYWEKKI